MLQPKAFALEFSGLKPGKEVNVDPQYLSFFRTGEIVKMFFDLLSCNSSCLQYKVIKMAKED